MEKNTSVKALEFSKTLILLFILAGPQLLAQSWTPVEPLPNNFRSDHSFGFAIDDIGYLVAGQTANGYSNAFYTYAADSDSWSELDDFPGDARGYAIGDQWDGKAWFGFGQGPNGFLNDLWVFDPSTGIWEEKASCPCSARMHPAFVAIDDHIYVGLGNSAAGDLNDWWEYDMTTDTWAQKPTFPDDQRHHPYQFGVDSQVYVGFGHHNTEIYNEWYRYDPSNETWTEMATLPDQGRVAGAQFAHAGKGYALSGDGEGHTSMPTGEFWQFDPANNSWSQWPAHPGMSRWAPSSFVINNEVYLINGMSMDPGTFDYMDTNWKLPMTPTLSSDAGIDGYLGETVVCGEDPVNVSTTLTNWGSDPLNSVQLELLVDGEVVLQQTWEGSLNSYESELVEMGSYGFATATPVAIQIATPDLNSSNNTVTASITESPEGTTEWLITLNTDNWGDETSWEIRDQNGMLVQLSSPDVYANQTEYEIEVSLPALGCYVFKLMDDYGDGMNGSEFGGVDGSCSIEALDNSGEPIGLIFDYDGSFSFDEITQKVNVNSDTSLGLGPTANAKKSAAYPNPFSDLLTLNVLGSLGAENSVISVFNGLGKLMHRSEIGSDPTNSVISLDTHSWSTGVYLIHIDFEGESFSQTQRVIKSDE
jgi:N-acetylneuraminic acid mutarotase